LLPEDKKKKIPFESAAARFLALMTVQKSEKEMKKVQQREEEKKKERKPLTTRFGRGEDMIPLKQQKKKTKKRKTALTPFSTNKRSWTTD
jgi:hypothetical protein